MLNETSLFWARMLRYGGIVRKGIYAVLFLFYFLSIIDFVRIKSLQGS